MKTSIWIVCFEEEDNIGSHLKQLLYKAYSMFESSNDAVISAICIGYYQRKFLKSLSNYGADEVIHLNQSFKEYTQISLELVHLIDEINNKPSLIIFPATERGRCIGADLATKIGAALVAECIDIRAKKTNKKYQFEFMRAAVNSTILARIKCINTQIGICTCKKDIFIAKKIIQKKDILINEKKCRYNYCLFPEPYVLHSESIYSEEKKGNFQNTNIVLGIGRGVRDKEGMELVEKVAKKYNASIVGTRAVVELGLIDKSCQVGQSGISISPKIYVAIGISGASQHIVGIKNAQIIISINTNPKAPIFMYSNYYIVDDYKKILQELIR